MKFTVTCLVSSANSSLLAESEAVTKEITVANPKANVQNLRATVAIQFRLNVLAFAFRFDHHEGAADGDSATPCLPPSASTTVDLGDEKKLLTECGLREGDHLTVVPKSYISSSVGGEAVVTSSGAVPLESSVAKRVRLEPTDPLEGSTSSADEEVDEESALDEDTEDDDDDKGRNDLFDALREVVPDLTVLRQEFLSNPQALMERIQRNHPSLFQVIAQNQETFVTLMNNEQLTRAAQGMLHGGTMDGDEDEEEEGSLEWSMGEEEEDEEMDEETADQMNTLLQGYMASVSRAGDGGDFDAADLAELEASGMQVEEYDGDRENASGGASAGKAKRLVDKDLILSRVPSEEDEEKIQALTELGFTYEQCKLAFYRCHRSIDRASNMLFEAPPEV
ncbi:hypothetical protein JKF63_00510 [Porcisia hertigi]|uniref:UBA domain-containing protein n=1 Tax=Porcisia hertigi TaxID=2761500 RepID=A0A836I8E1_9TRYP|nr:hypothetical protein JKF63_00510 [Porcisia hertigi]